jgi:hypothetical protein
MDYESLTLLDLKKLCKQRGLKISGSKDDVVIRLMEADELQSGAPQPIVYQQGGLAGPIPSVQQIIMPQKSSMYETLGTFIILYALVRIGWSMLWTLNNDQMIGWLLAPVGFLIGMGFLVGGVLIYQEYKNGIYLTMGVLVLSGLLSVAFHAENMSEMNPVTLVWGDTAMFMTSIMCSFSCLAIVGLPLLLGDGNMKPGWPPSLQRIVDATGGGNKKKQVSCGSCGEKLNVPKDYSGTIQCPACKSNMKV